MLGGGFVSWIQVLQAVSDQEHSDLVCILVRIVLLHLFIHDVSCHIFEAIAYACCLNPSESGLLSMHRACGVGI